jgi:hypothetical protein
VATGLQVAVSVDDAPAFTEGGEAVSVQVGVVSLVTVNDALAAAPIPAEFTPATVYVVDAFGDTVQVDPVCPAQLPPVQTYDEAVGEQLAFNVEEAPAAMDAGDAVNVQLGLINPSPLAV